MPELPEVETIRRGLAPRLIGKTIEEITVRESKMFSGDEEAVIGRYISELRRHGKLLVFILDDGHAITVHLKMTGQLIWKPAKSASEEAVMGGHPSEGYLDPLPHKHTHVVIDFSDGSTLYFNDLRKFGMMSVLDEKGLEELHFIQKLGPEPLDKEFTSDYLAQQIKKHPRVPIKSFLLDQTNIAGLGNIYADESLFRAAILPVRLSGSLTSGEVRNLHAAIGETLELALLYGGSSEKDYVNAIGEKGTYLKIAQVYHRTGQQCVRCLEGTIERVKVAGRSTHYCPECQH